MSLRPKRIEFDETWSRIRATVEVILTANEVERNVWNNSFFDIYALIVAIPASLGDKLYNATKLHLQEHVVVEKLSIMNLKNEVDLLPRYNQAWSKYYKGISYLDELYSNFNKMHIKQQHKYKGLTDNGRDDIEKLQMVDVNDLVYDDTLPQVKIKNLGLIMWRKIAFSEKLGNMLASQMLDSIEADRRSPVDENRVKDIKAIAISLIQMEIPGHENDLNIDLYESLFQVPMLAASEKYFTDKAEKLIKSCTVSKYLEELVLILKSEEERVDKFMHGSSKASLIYAFGEIFVKNQLGVLQSAFEKIMYNDCLTDLKNLYIVLNTTPRHFYTILVINFRTLVKSVAIQKIVRLRGANIHVQYIDDMLELHNKFCKLIAEIFDNDAILLNALKETWTKIINGLTSPGEPCRSAEYAAMYSDGLLKKSRASRAAKETKLTKIVFLLKFIEEKDLFQKFYRRMMAKRLLLDKYHSMRLERSMLNRIEEILGYNLTYNLYQMLLDIETADELNLNFNYFLRNEDTELGIKVHVKVINSRAWPEDLMPFTSFAIPQAFQMPVEMFEQFFHTTTTGRKLMWNFQMCRGQVRLWYLKETYDVSLQMFPMAILLCFENSDSLTFKEIQTSLQLNPETIEKYMKPLLDLKLLIASDTSLDANTKIKLNFEFSHPSTQFKVVMSNTAQNDALQRVEAMNSKTKDENLIDQDRKLFLQATIVRIMKSRKVLQHYTLITEIMCLPNLHFSPSIGMIKGCIEYLIVKGYIERSTSSADVYNYVP